MPPIRSKVSDSSLTLSDITGDLLKILQIWQSPLVALTRKGAPFVWTDWQQTAFEALKACLVRAPILGFHTEGGRFVLDTDASLFAVGGTLSQLQKDREVVIAYASRSLRLSQRRYCTTRQEMLAAVVMCTHFRLYLRGAQFTLQTDHSSLRWLQRLRNGDGMLARWYLLLGQFSVTFEYRPGAQQANADGMSRQCGQCQRPDCPVSATDSPLPDAEPETEMVDQPLAASEMGKSMDADLLPELSGETWVASALIEEFMADLLPAGSNVDLIAVSLQDATLATLREWFSPSPLWHGRIVLDFLRSCAKGNRYVLVMVDCFSPWKEACPLPDKTVILVADAFFSNIVCRFGMPSVIHSDQGREFENKVMHELCILCGSHKTKTTPYHPESDGLVERFNRTLLQTQNITLPELY